MISTIVNVLTVSILMLFFTLAIYFLVDLKIENNKLKLKNAQLTADMLGSLHFMSEKINIEPELENQSKEAFLKFVSDSRDAAYEYIEKTQGVIDKFIKDVEPTIQYHRMYGDVSRVEPYYSQLSKISEAFDELITIMPKEDNPQM